MRTILGSVLVLLALYALYDFSAANRIIPGGYTLIEDGVRVELPEATGLELGALVDIDIEGLWVVTYTTKASGDPVTRLVGNRRLFGEWARELMVTTTESPNLKFIYFRDESRVEVSHSQGPGVSVSGRIPKERQ